MLLAMGAFLAVVVNVTQFLFYVKKQADDNNVRESPKITHDPLINPRFPLSRSLSVKSSVKNSASSSSGRK